MGKESKNTSFWSGRQLWWLSAAIVVCLALVGVFNYSYFVVKTERNSIDKFTEQLHERENYANKFLDQMVQRVNTKGINDVLHDKQLFADSENSNVSLFIFKGDSICYWSNNKVDIRTPGQVPIKQLCYIVTNNSYCVCVQRSKGDYRYAAFIRFRQKHNAGMSLSVSPVEGFDLPVDVEIVDKATPGAIQVNSANGAYLFSVKYDAYQNHSPLFYWLTIVFSFLAFSLLLTVCWIVVSRARSGKLVSWVAFAVTVFLVLLVAVVITLGWPNALFANSGSVRNPSFMLSKFIVYTVLFFWMAYVARTLYPKFTIGTGCQSRWSRCLAIIGCQLASSAIFIGVYALVVYMIYHSSIDVATSLVQDISEETVLSIFLAIPWFFFVFYLGSLFPNYYFDKAYWKVLLISHIVLAVGGFLFIYYGMDSLAHLVAWTFFSVVSLLIELYSYFFTRRSFFYAAAIAFAVINLTVAVCYFNCQARNAIHYEALANKYTNNLSLIQNPDDEAIMVQNGSLIVNDPKFAQLMEDSVSRYDNMERYLLDTYFDGFGNKYEFDVQIRGRNEAFTVRKGYYDNNQKYYPSFLSTYCKPIAKSYQFYICEKADSPLAYVGVFIYKSEVVYVFMYPNLSVYRQEQDDELYSPSNNSVIDRDISVAKFFDNEMLFVSGSYHYPNNASWIPNVNKHNFHVYKNDCTHYIARFADGGYVVVTKMEHRSYTYFIFVSYLCALCAIGIFTYGFYWWISRRRRHAQNSILTRMQFWLLVPMLLAFVVLGVCSLYFFMGQYKNKAVNNINEQANSIQLQLQQNIGFSKSLYAIEYRDLSQDLKDLSNLFRSDIVLYDAGGRQVASSRSTFLNEKRRSKRLMNPVPHFLHQTDYFTDANFGASNYFSFYTYLYNQHNEMVGYVNVRSFSAAKQMKSEVFNLLVVLIDVYLVIVLLTVTVSWFISRRMVKPVTMLSDQFKEIKLTGSNAKVEYNDNDELGVLVQQYNVMVDKLQISAEQLAKSQREMAWREMARRIAHEIKNPLTPMKLSVQMAQMKQKRDPDNFAEYFQKMSALLIEQIDNLSRIASEFSTFAKSTVTVREEVNLAAKLQSVVTLFENNPEGVRFELDMHDVDTAMVWSDNKQILQVFNNLFKNAIQAIPDDREGLIKVDFKLGDEAALVAITDNGCGIPEENLKTIFQPNFTTKTSGNGLGLPIVKTIVNLANGEIWLDSKVGVGTTFFIRIPLIKPGETAESVQSITTQPDSNS